MTVGEYPSISSYYSLLTLSHLRNFTLQTPRVSLVRASAGRRLGPSARSRILRHFTCRRFLRSDASEVPRLSRPGGSSARSVADPSTLLRRRFLGLNASEVPRLRRAPSYPRTWEGRRLLLSSLVGLRQYQSLHTLSITRRVINISLFSVSSACIRTEAPWVKDILRRFRSRRISLDATRGRMRPSPNNRTASCSSSPPWQLGSVAVCQRSIDAGLAGGRR